MEFPRHGLDLAVHIISSHFGNLVGKVCRCLLERGSLSLQKLQHYTQLQKDQLKKCLLVLIQHNCVQAFIVDSEEDDEADQNVVLYTALYDHILHRLRFSKFLQIVSERFDSQCEELLMGLLQHGRQTLESVIARVMSIRNEGNSDVQDVHRSHFVKLVDARFVERCPSAQPVVKPNPPNPVKRRGVKFAGAPLTTEQRAVAEAAPSDLERFSVIVDTGNDIDAINSEQCGSFTAGVKRKYEALETDNETMAENCEKVVHWRANFEEFVRCLRHKACVAHVRSKMDVKTGTILEAILEESRKQEMKVKEEKSVSLSMDAILQLVRGRPEGLEMTSEHVKAALEQLGCVPQLEGLEMLYSVDLKSILEEAKQSEVEATVLNRYGPDAYRIFRLLAKHNRFVETNKVADNSLIDKKTAAVILSKLWKDGFLDMERMDVALSRQQTIFVWKLKKYSLWEHVLDMVCHAALNLSHRMAYEFEQDQELLQIELDLMTEAQRKRFVRCRRVRLLLESSVLKLDDAMLLLHDF